MKKPRVAIIGAGPAGIACAIQLRRYNIEPVIFEKNSIGGLVRNANFIENYPGFSAGISGHEFVNALRYHARKYHIEFVKEEVMSLTHSKNKFQIKSNKNNYKFPIVVIASGTEPKKIPLKLPEKAKARIFYGMIGLKHLSGRKICIIGSGDVAFDYGLSLSRKNKVTILMRSGKPRCLPILYKRAQKNKNITLFFDILVKKIKINQNLLRLECTRDRNFLCDFLLIAIGRNPSLGFVSKRLKHKFGDLVKQNRLYIIGDANDRIYRQTAIAVGDGVKAAMKIALRYCN